MATFKEFSKGSITVTRSVIVEDAFTQDSSFDVALIQPAGTVLSKCYVRFITAPDFDNSSTLTIDIGTASDDDAILDGASLMAANAADPAAGTIVRFTDADFGLLDKAQTSGISGTAPGYSDAQRDVHVKITTSNHTVTTNGDIAITLFFDHIG